jgi:hypothetical protein
MPIFVSEGSSEPLSQNLKDEKASNINSILFYYPVNFSVPLYKSYSHALLYPPFTVSNIYAVQMGSESINTPLCLKYCLLSFINSSLFLASSRMNLIHLSLLKYFSFSTTKLLLDFKTVNSGGKVFLIQLSYIVIYTSIYIIGKNIRLGIFQQAVVTLEVTVTNHEKN